MVKKVTPIEFSCSDTFCFLEDLHKHAIKDKFTVSFDICSLFINIPLHETIDLAVDRIMKNDPSLKITRKELCELFEFATSILCSGLKGRRPFWLLNPPPRGGGFLACCCLCFLFLEMRRWSLFATSKTNFIFFKCYL